MATAISQQLVSTYHDSIIEASSEAVACWDASKALQEAVILAPSIVSGIRSLAADPRQGSVEERQHWAELCEHLLESLTTLARKLHNLREYHFPFKGLAELRESMTELRLVLASIREADGPDVELPPCADTAESFKAAAKEMGPPESWYAEDFTKVRGPVV
jgi:hypothetical protein